jgi:Spy/CpxP family protein refolding chaperone
MKQWNFKSIMILAAALLLATGIDAMAQRGRGMGRMGGMQQVCPNIPGLTEEQRGQIMQLRTRHLGEMQAYRDQIDISRVQYRALMRSGGDNTAAINSKIDELSAIRNAMEKKRAGHHQEIRSLLNDDQRVWFDSAPGRFGGGAGLGPAGPGMRGGLCPYAPGPRGGRGIMRNQPQYRSGV